MGSLEENGGTEPSCVLPARYAITSSDEPPRSDSPILALCIDAVSDRPHRPPLLLLLNTKGRCPLGRAFESLSASRSNLINLPASIHPPAMTEFEDAKDRNPDAAASADPGTVELRPLAPSSSTTNTVALIDPPPSKPDDISKHSSPVASSLASPTGLRAGTSAHDPNPKSPDTSRPSAVGVGRVVVPVEITVRNLSVTAVSRAAGPFTKKGTGASTGIRLLEDVTFHVPSGHLMAIMGGSGSGKTTLLNALAGRATGRVEGEILFNGEHPRRFLKGGAVAYVQQQDSLLPYLTVRDTLRYAARLRLPRTMSLREKDAMVESVILELGLKECADTLIGDEWRKGISGGEKRRVSVGVQLLLNPSVIYMDEPTTGLDAFSARSLIETLTTLCATHNRTIIISIHQPRSDIFTSFTHITLLATRGRLAYAGTRVGAIEHFAGLGYVAGGEVNGADFLIDVTSVDNRTPAAEEASSRRVEEVVDAWRKVATKDARDVVDPQPGTAPQLQIEESPLLTPDDSAKYGHRGATFLQQVGVLTGRVLANMREDRLTLWGSIGEVFMLGLVMGSIFYRMEESPAGILSRKSLLYSVCALQNYLGLMFIIWKLCTELKVFDRERADKMYSVPAYLLSWYSINTFLYALLAIVFSILIYFMTGLRTDDLAYHFGIFVICSILMQLVTISLGYFCVSFSRDFASASLIGNSIFTFLSMSSGFFIPLTSIPIYLRWIQSFSYITLGLRIYATNEFKDKVYACPNLPRGTFVCRGESALQQLGMDPGLAAPFAGLAALIVGLVLLTGLNLHFFPASGNKQAGKVTPSSSPAQGKVADEGTTDEVAVDVASSGTTPPPRVTLRVDALSLSLVRTPPLLPSRRTTTPILHSISATFQPGTLTAILGSSGAGKSTLLSLLHARTPRLGAFTVPEVTGQLLHNGRVLTRQEVGVLTASVRQDDGHLLPALTARETLMYAAMLRLTGVSKEERRERAERLLWELGLKDCADTIVGGEGVKGLSGGEKRRLSVGLALLTDPAVLLLDEPTSGLDAATASNMIHLLKRIASSGRTVVCTIHQPRSDLFPLFDNLLLLARGGRVVYEGTGPGLLKHLAHHGHHLPPLTNPADFALDVSSVDLRGDAAEEASRARVDALVKAWKEVEDSRRSGTATAAGTNGSTTTLNLGAVSKPLPFFLALPILVGRSFRNLRRQGGLVSARIAQTAALGVILTMYFARLGRDQASITTRIGFLQQIGAIVFIGMLNCIAVFPQELRLFRFEHEDGAYSVEAFFWTYTINELPFDALGAFLFAILACYAVGLKANLLLMAFLCFGMITSGESFGLAFCSMISQPGFSVQIMSAIISIMSIMAGFLSVNMPKFLDVLNHASMLRYAARASARDEFLGLSFDCPPEVRAQPGAICTGQDAMDLLAFDSSWKAFQINLAAAAACVVAYRVLGASALAL
ncbi:hypothetical protein HDU96_005078 [Phlyctochytrium bullatum]|nr:hypothetical protein HDU96_005078 [Phlyctochytrium bullatum]